MKRYTYGLLAGFLCMAGLVSFVLRDDLTSTLQQYLQTYRVNYAPEEVYVQTDKPYYIAGETIWLKAYLTDGSSQKPSQQSGVLYVYLIDQDGQAARQLKLKVKDGDAAGNIDLPDSLAAGNYYLTAYTNWMRNFGEKTFFRQPIHIWKNEQPSTDATSANDNKETNPQANTPTSPASIDLQFFPEGGDMVAGLEGQVAFKAVDEQGLGTPVEGFIVDDQGQKITEFQSFHAGMGAITLTPKPHRTYTARLVKKDGATQDFLLPQAKEEGVSLQVQEYSQNPTVDIQIRESQPTDEPLVLTAISQNDLVYAEKITLQDGRFATHIDKAKFPTGIVRFTLSNEQGEPFAERLAYIRPQSQLQLSISTNEQEFLPREKVQMHIEAKDAEGHPVAANLSLAVTNQDMVSPLADQKNIVSYLTLSSDLKGHIENPTFYFQQVNDTTKQALQYLMMTQGWRHFTWEEALSGKYPKMPFAREQDLSITGQLVDKKGAPVSNGEMILYLQDQYQTFIIQHTDDKGNFKFDGFDFADSVSLTVQGTTESGKRNTEVKIDHQNYVPPTPDWHIPMANQLTASTNQGYVDFSQQRLSTEDAYQPELRDMVLKEITVEDRVDIVESSKLHTRADQVLRAQDLTMPPPSGNILESLQGRVAGLRVTRDGWNDFRATIRGMGEPLYLLDGMPINRNTVSGINPWDVDHIEILKGPEASIYGGRASGGVIAFYTKRGGVEYEEVEPGPYIINFRAGGYTKARAFYAPKYPVSSQEEKKPDLRTTIHWAPNVQTGSDGKATVSFFTADQAATYRAIVEGLTPAGLPGSQVYTFDVIQPNNQNVGK